MAEMASKRERKCSTEKDMTALSKGAKRLCLPMEREGYDRLNVIKLRGVTQT